MNDPIFIRICQVYGARVVAGPGSDPDPNWDYRAAIDDSAAWIAFMDAQRATYQDTIPNPNVNADWSAAGMRLTAHLRNRLAASALGANYDLIIDVIYVPAYDEKGRLIGHAVIFGIADRNTGTMHVTPDATHGDLHGFVSVQLSL